MNEAEVFVNGHEATIITGTANDADIFS
jgi:hypothetical protein